MTKETMENIVSGIIYKRLEKYSYIKSDEALNVFEEFCDNSEDLEEIFELLTNTKKFNYVLLQNGESYFVCCDFLSWRIFLCEVEISDRDEVWNEFFYYNNSSERLRDIWEEVANV